MFISTSQSSRLYLNVHPNLSTAMSRTLIRPTPAAVTAIQEALITSELSPRARRQLRAVLAWANGKNTRQVATDATLKMSDFTVRRAIHLYRKAGINGFTQIPAPAVGARKPISAAQEAAVVEDLQRSFERGEAVTYRALHAKYGIALGKIAAIARKHRLDPAHRRGRVAPPAEG
jgi:transposase